MCTTLMSNRWFVEMIYVSNWSAINFKNVVPNTFPSVYLYFFPARPTLNPHYVDNGMGHEVDSINTLRCSMAPKVLHAKLKVAGEHLNRTIQSMINFANYIPDNWNC